MATLKNGSFFLLAVLLAMYSTIASGFEPPSSNDNSNPAFVALVEEIEENADDEEELEKIIAREKAAGNNDLLARALASAGQNMADEGKSSSAVSRVLDAAKAAGDESSDGLTKALVSQAIEYSRSKDSSISTVASSDWSSWYGAAFGQAGFSADFGSSSGSGSGGGGGSASPIAGQTT